jgi:hypothetical protein
VFEFFPWSPMPTYLRRAPAAESTGW